MSNATQNQTKSESPYEELIGKYKELRHFYDGLSTLHWDTKTYMPTNGISQRGQTLAVMSKIGHEMITNPRIGELLQRAEQLKDLSERQKRNIYLIRKEYERATKVPNDLVMELVKQQTYTEHIWEKAKQKSDFNLVVKELQKLYELTKKRAEIINPDKDVYDVLLDEFEPNLTAAQITTYFNPLRDGVIEVMRKCRENAVEAITPDILKVKTTIEQQKAISKWIMDFIQLEPTRARIDESEHPFTVGYLDDVRITTHYLDNDPMASVYSVFHEGGHALYDMNLPRESAFEPISEGASYGIHESQSRFIENLVAKNPAFLEYFYDELIKIVPEYKKISKNDFIKAINLVIPSKIRIYADEVSYNLHIVLRFEIERDLFAEKITIKELPHVWNEKMEKYFGIEIKEDKEGVLQDTHWYGGAFGYFPSYALGNIYNGQMLWALQKDIKNYDDLLHEGKFDPIREWLINNVQKYGSLYDPVDLIKKATGETPNSKYFVDYMKNKFGKIFDF